MSVEMYEFSVAITLQKLAVMKTLLEKGLAHAEEKGFDSANLVNARLAPDMFTLSTQVQVACDVSKGCAARLSGIEAPSYKDTETTFAELLERIDKTVAFIESVPAEKINGTEGKRIEIKAGPFELKFSGSEYVQQFVLPNLFFHLVTAYNLLRHNGVSLGKADYLGLQQGK